MSTRTRISIVAFLISFREKETDETFFTSRPSVISQSTDNANVVAFTASKVAFAFVEEKARGFEMSFLHPRLTLGIHHRGLKRRIFARRDRAIWTEIFRTYTFFFRTDMDRRVASINYRAID
jgi:hypothetical protein